jgi:hypothetical protein
VMVNGRKQILRLAEGALSLFDLAKDPREARGLAADAQLSRRLQDWMGTVQKGLIASDRLGPAEVASEDAAQLRALGYLQ